MVTRGMGENIPKNTKTKTGSDTSTGSSIKDKILGKKSSTSSEADDNAYVNGLKGSKSSDDSDKERGNRLSEETLADIDSEDDEPTADFDLGDEEPTESSNTWEQYLDAGTALREATANDKDYQEINDAYNSAKAEHDKAAQAYADALAKVGQAQNQKEYSAAAAEAAKAKATFEVADKAYQEAKVNKANYLSANYGDYVDDLTKASTAVSDQVFTIAGIKDNPYVNAGEAGEAGQADTAKQASSGDTSKASEDMGAKYNNSGVLDTYTGVKDADLESSSDAAQQEAIEAGNVNVNDAADDNKTNYYKDPFNQGMQATSTDSNAISDEDCKRFSTVIIKHEPITRAAIKKMIKAGL